MDRWHLLCEHPPEMIAPDPYASGWEMVAVMDPSGSEW